MLRGHETQHYKRSKRAWFSGMGKISRFLFGTLDEEAELELKPLIGVSVNDTRDLLNLMANRTKLMSSEFRILHQKAFLLEDVTHKLIVEQIESKQEAIFDAALESLTDNVLQYELDTNH